MGAGGKYVVRRFDIVVLKGEIVECAVFRRNGVVVIGVENDGGWSVGVNAKLIGVFAQFVPVAGFFAKEVFYGAVVSVAAVGSHYGI